MKNNHKGSVTLAEVEAAIAKLEAAGVNPLTANRGQIKMHCGLKERRARTVREWIRRSTMQAPTVANQTTQEVSADSWVISISGTEVGTVEELMNHCKVDAGKWDVQKFFTRHDPKTGLFHSRANFRRKVEVMDAREELDFLKVEACKAAKIYPPVKYSGAKTGHRLELNIPDLHVGKLAWSKETGWENYDADIAEQDFEDTLTSLLNRTASYDFDSILFVIGNDLLHTDNREGLTTAGTPQNVDGRYQKTFAAVRRMKCRAIERLRQLAPVECLMVPGNHDTLSVWQLGDSLQCYFHNCADVQIDNTPNLRKYTQWGDNMLMLTHGNKGKLDNYPLLMAVEQPQMWAATKFREAHTGDKHQLKVQEHHGVRVRILSSLTPPDAWHSENHYVGNVRSAEAFIWHEKQGLVGTAVHSLVNV